MTLVQPAAWAVSGFACLFFLSWAFRAWRKDRPGRAPLYAAASAATVALLVIPSFGFVPAGHRGVVYEWGGGVSMGERNEGITLLVPWIQTMRNLSVRTQKVFSSKVFAQSSDLQEITVVASVNYHIDPARAAELYQRVGPAYRETVIQPALFQRTKAAIGQVKAESFAQRRERLALTIQRQIAEQLSSYGIIVEYVNIEDAIFDPKFVLAVKNKIIAEQKAQEQQRLIAAQEAIKEQTIIKAEATARSILIRANAQAKANVKLARSVTPALIRWQWLVKWNGILPTTLVGGDDATLLIGIGGPTATGY